ncbi:hypothetical protein DRE_04656 [Drechslerella stenobrocha 248]|uniref:Uncharacterized protein n=1 Tax=Drechslerella stenobrocha 248 TaxID=1043628 RepID=W7I0R9_9PEZI|nr:hypothetical protein DRE_04656 [Drechslerella stenobrocha 248]
MAIHLLDLLSPAEPILYKAIFDDLGPVDTIRLLSTCKALQQFKGILWSINRSLTRFVDKPIAFRSLMARHDAVVSGSHALQFLERIQWAASDLDVYIHTIEGLLAFARHLVEDEGYSFSPYSWQSADATAAIVAGNVEASRHVNNMLESLGERDNDPEEALDEAVTYSLREISAVFNFVHIKIPARRIQLIAPRTTTLTAIMGDYYATHIFNFFTWDRAYSLFPYHTFQRRRAFYTNALTRKSVAAVNKYIDRGYSFQEYGEFHECVRNCPLRPHRCIGDKYTWVVPLDTEGVDAASVAAAAPHSLMETSSWGMRMHISWWNREDQRRMFRGLPFIQLQYEIDISPVFRYPRLYSRRTETLYSFLVHMKRTADDGRTFRFKFDGSKERDWSGAVESARLDDQFESWYRFWEAAVLPYENIWIWQYPMLDGKPEITIRGQPHEEVEDLENEDLNNKDLENEDIVVAQG